MQVIEAPHRKIKRQVMNVLDLVGLRHRANAYPNELSGGEQQRTAIARALINRPEILIADEPTGNLDHENAVSIMKLLERIHAQGTTVIVITHDLELVRMMNKRTVHMADGEIISDSAAEEASESVASAEAEKAVPEMQRRRSRKRSTAEESMSEETASIRENVSELSSKTVSTERPRGLGGSHRPRHVSRRKGGDVR